MTKYVLRRTDQGGGYVKNFGGTSSYTQSLQHARRYESHEAAEADRCQGNEVVEEV